MKWYDVTRPLSGDMLVYPGDICPVFHQEKPGKYRISELHLSSHTGTHIDAPSHYLDAGDPIDKVPLETLIGGCRVVDVSGAGSRITKEHLAGKIEGAERLFLKTGYSGINTFIQDYPCLTTDAAVFITACGIRCIGIDSPSIEIFNCDGSVHRELLSHYCIIIELLDLSGVPEGIYDMIALPLNLKDLDGSPARVILTAGKEDL
ncbi:cyclase family protein [uncultured Methanoregula sp.]|uniref:cyclase family protein n=1 Tax=uncultured Methanoregula sp. TaxID=1005933 RepID=UPI002AAB34F3|nr:cyclase family protein [uncultured Methanoregula sp.]